MTNDVEPRRFWLALEALYGKRDDDGDDVLRRRARPTLAPPAPAG